MGSLKDSIEIAKSATEAARSTPEGKTAASNLGKTAVTLTETINNALLPLAAINYGFEKARKYFRDKFEADLNEKTKHIPPHELQEPKASLAGPALQGLAFTHDEEELRNMYLSLLASAMDARVSMRAHPAFVEIIRQLNAKEAKHLEQILKTSGYIPIVELRQTTNGESGHRVLLTHLLPLVSADTGAPTRDPELPVMVKNWMRLGLVDVGYSESISDSAAYSWVEDRPEMQEFRAELENTEDSLSFEQGLLACTEFGTQFARSVGIIDGE